MIAKSIRDRLAPLSRTLDSVSPIFWTPRAPHAPPYWTQVSNKMSKKALKIVFISHSTSLASVSVQTTEVTRVATLTVSALGLV